MYRYTDIQIYRYKAVQIYRYTDIQIYRYTDIQIYRYTDIQLYRYTDIQIYRYTDIQIFEAFKLNYIKLTIFYLTGGEDGGDTNKKVKKLKRDIRKNVGKPLGAKGKPLLQFEKPSRADMSALETVLHDFRTIFPKGGEESTTGNHKPLFCFFINNSFNLYF